MCNIEEVELTLKNEIYKEPKKKKDKKKLKSVDSSLDVINNIIIGASELMASLSGINVANSRSMTVPGLAPHVKTTQVNPTVDPQPRDELTKTVRLMLLHPDLPDYVRTIQDRNVRDQLLEKMAEAFLHYSNRIGSSVDIPEFFKLWTKQLKEQGRLNTHCKWKGIPIELDDNGWCTEYNCSKLPYRSKCPQTTYKFGVRSDTV